MKYVREFLLEDYKLKVDMVTQHYQRILTSFNYFLAIQSSLVVVTGFLIKPNFRTGSKNILLHQRVIELKSV
jgi:hypothetical protein